MPFHSVRPPPLAKRFAGGETSGRSSAGRMVNPSSSESSPSPIRERRVPRSSLPSSATRDSGLLDDGRLFRGEPQIGDSRTESSGDSVLCNAPCALSERHEGEGRRQGARAVRHIAAAITSSNDHPESGRQWSRA